jgi:hypothetical protein
MTIAEHVPYSSRFDVSHPIPVTESRADPIGEARAEPTGMDVAVPRHRSRFSRFTAGARARRYNYPRRERFVEEAAMSREMFRL